MWRDEAGPYASTGEAGRRSQEGYGRERGREAHIMPGEERGKREAGLRKTKGGGNTTVLTSFFYCRHSISVSEMYVTGFQKSKHDKTPKQGRPKETTRKEMQSRKRSNMKTQDAERNKTTSSRNKFKRRSAQTKTKPQLQKKQEPHRGRRDSKETPQKKEQETERQQEQVN